MKYVVEARIYDNGKIVTKMYHTADKYVQSSYTSFGKCDVWIDVFDNEKTTRAFLEDYKTA